MLLIQQTVYHRSKGFIRLGAYGFLAVYESGRGPGYADGFSGSQVIGNAFRILVGIKAGGKLSGIEADRAGIFGKVSFGVVVQI